MNKTKAMNVFKSNLSGEQFTDMCRIFCLEGNNYGKLISFKACDVERYVSDTSEIIDRCIDELESFCVPEIQELLDVYEAFMESEAE